MKKCYTISSLKALSELPKLDSAQFTLNSHQFPSSRKTVVALQNLAEAGSTTPIYVHYDYIYIASRYGFFASDVKNAILCELCSILHYAERDSNIRGIVMHTDFPLKRDIYKEKKRQAIFDSYTSSIWNKQAIIEHWSDGWFWSIHRLLEDLHKAYQGVPPIKIYLENSTKTGLHAEGDIYSILCFFHEYPEASNYFGICYDTEHHYALYGDFLPTIELDIVNREIAPVLVHINAVPETVQPGSGKDRHSDVTIFDCSVNTPAYYMEYSNALDEYNIPWLREVHTETMLKEIEELENYGSNDINV